MHVLWFRMKRALHASLRIGRDILARWPPLTPARFDLLFMVHQARSRFVDQKDLTRMLGVHHSTVSKMLTRLEELRIVVRAPVEGDFRQRMVCLTPEGRRLMDEAIYEIMGDGYTNLAVSLAVLPLRFYDDRRVHVKIRRLCGTLRRYALTFDDTAIALYAPSSPCTKYFNDPETRPPPLAALPPPRPAARWQPEDRKPRRRMY